MATELWAQFKDANGDINDINNYIQGPCSLPEWGTGYRHPDYWNGWRLVPSDYKPPEPVKTKEEKLSILDAEYQPQFDALSIAWANASMDSNNTLAASIKADKDALLAEYTTKREAITSAS
jgi:hypothetical protein